MNDIRIESYAADPPVALIGRWPSLYLFESSGCECQSVGRHNDGLHWVPCGNCVQSSPRQPLLLLSHWLWPPSPELLLIIAAQRDGFGSVWVKGPQCKMLISKTMPDH